MATFGAVNALIGLRSCQRRTVSDSSLLRRLRRVTFAGRGRPSNPVFRAKPGDPPCVFIPICSLLFGSSIAAPKCKHPRKHPFEMRRLAWSTAGEQGTASRSRRPSASSTDQLIQSSPCVFVFVSRCKSLHRSSVLRLRGSAYLHLMEQ